jgi:hypothetical protein
MKGTLTGYTVTATPVSLNMSIDGREIDSPILSLLRKITVVYDLDSKGDILYVKGYEELEQLIQDSFPSRTRTCDRVVNPATAGLYQLSYLKILPEQDSNLRQGG